MRTRRSNKTKRYFEVASSDNEDEGRHVSSPAHREDAGAASNEDVSDEDGSDAAFSGSDAEMVSRGRPSARRKQSGAATTSAPTILVGSSPSGGPSRGDPHALPPYPLESRVATRVFTGQLRRDARVRVMRDLMYGPHYESVRLIWDLMDRWFRYPVLPAALAPRNPEGVLPSPWLPPGFEATQASAARKWYRSYLESSSETQSSHSMLPKHGQKLMSLTDGSIITLLGPWDGQKEYRMRRGDGYLLSPSGLPVEDLTNPSATPAGWVFDVAGLVLSLDWASIPSGDTQVLAMAVVPHSDQVAQPPGNRNATQDDRKVGSIQLWSCAGIRTSEDRLREPARALPKCMAVKFFDWGRPKRLQWCPVSFLSSGLYGLLAILCGDGRVRVLEIKEQLLGGGGGPIYEWVETPVATLGISDEYNVHATCLSWVGINRIVLGHSDGSLSLWSIHPTKMLQRHAVHSNFVLDVSSAYPSHPYLVASVPVGGFVTLIDLTQPSSETTCVSSPTIAFQPGLLGWNDHMQGWLGPQSSTGPGATSLVFLHARAFCLPRTMATMPSPPTALSVGGPHPFALAGCADGSLWGFNALGKLFKGRGERSFKMKLFEHEFRPVDAFADPNVVASGADEGEVEATGKTTESVQGKKKQEASGQEDGSSADSSDGEACPLRGASRFLQGFVAQPNEDPRTERMRGVAHRKMAEKGKTKAGKRKGRPPKRKTATIEAEDEDDEERDAVEEGHAAAEEGAQPYDSRFVIHEPLTRVTAVAWNPNPEFGCWAAVALGSGLVRIMNVGVD
ncbi:hypothetical protein VTK73DRAFT_9006 [Phialemonium thermophilum]|uniref:Uncharacterized protein n=1 Tax=Phialemonium thermophilum TaxID=223376 RepID=A0ABR3W5B5_9PEZI